MGGLYPDAQPRLYVGGHPDFYNPPPSSHSQRKGRLASISTSPTTSGVAASPTAPDDVPTPGTGYYRYRHILGDHALRYMDENPILAMRLSDPSTGAHSHCQLSS